MTGLELSIIGAGRVGQALAVRSRAQDGLDRLVTRTQGWDKLERPAGQPIAVCVRNDDLDAVVQRTPPHRRGDLVFLQNGMLRGWLDERGLSGATRGLLFFAVAQRGAEPVPGGVSPLSGPHAAVMAQWLCDLSLPAEALEAGPFAEVELEKLLWNCCLGVLCQAKACDVGQAVTAHRGILSGLVAELVQVAAEAFAPATSPAELTERLTQYSLQIADYRAQVKEWPWRNGWFVAEAQRRGLASPIHLSLLELAGAGPPPTPTIP